MLSPKQTDLINRLLEIIRDNGQPMPSIVLARVANIPQQAVVEVMNAGVSGGMDVASLGLSGFAAKDWCHAILAGASAMYGDQAFGPRNLREDFGVPRRVVMDLLDYWQKQGRVEKHPDGFVVRSVY